MRAPLEQQEAVMISDSKERYGSISRTLHWLVALLVFWQLLKFIDRIAKGEHWIGETLVPWHISIGSLLLLLAVFRILWAISQRNHRPGPAPSEAVLTKAGHGLLYAGLLLMPITGIMVMLGGGYGVSAFGIEIFAKGRNALGKNFGELHSPLAWILTVLIIGHIGIALIHHFVRRDRVLKRIV